MPNAVDLLKPLQGAIEHVKSFLASNENLFIQIQLDDDENYFHLLARNDFAFTDINGQLDSVEVGKA